MTDECETVEATIIRLEKEMAALVMRVQELEYAIERRVDCEHGTMRTTYQHKDRTAYGTYQHEKTRSEDDGALS